MSRCRVFLSLCTAALFIPNVPAANGACLLTCPYASQPYPNYGCAAGGFLITSWSVQDLGGGAISIHPNPNGIVPNLIGTMDCDAGTFSTTSSSPGGCTIQYSLNGVLTSATQWTGTFKVQYLGGVSCADCLNQTFGVSGSCTPSGVTGALPVSGWITASPNPAQGSTSLRFYSPGEDVVTLEIFDVTGRHLQTLVDHVVLPPGIHEVPWSATLGATASAVHFARLTAGENVEITRFVLVH
ncbi:MAG TPA: T9SS type A sorting domain-containing protein [bacterium]|nr:T9SS type A sorting domain-containing protein [bacterium]